MKILLMGPSPGTVFRTGDFGARGRAEASGPKGMDFKANQPLGIAFSRGAARRWGFKIMAAGALAGSGSTPNGQKAQPPAAGVSQ